MAALFISIGCIAGAVFISIKQAKEASANAPFPVKAIFRVPFYLFVQALIVLFYTYASANRGNFTLYWVVLFLNLIYSIAFVIYRIWFIFRYHPKSQLSQNGKGK